MQSGYSPRDLTFDVEARRKLLDGAFKMYKAVGSTMGPCGQTVILESDRHTYGLRVTKDGVTVAKEIQLMDPIENLAVRIMREAAERTGTMVGDGTTTSIVIAYALLRAGLDAIDVSVNKTQTLNNLVSITSQVIKDLEGVTTEVGDEMVAHIASISANNDKVIGDLIAGAYKEVGRRGIVKVVMSDGVETVSKVTDGLKVERGYSSEAFITDHSKDTWDAEDVVVLVSSIEINNLMTMELVLADIIKNRKRLLVIGPCTDNVKMTLAVNNRKGVLKVCVVPPPSFGYRSKELMSDIAVALGATHFSEDTGDDMSIIRYSDLGSAKSVTVSKDDTIIVVGERENSEEVERRIQELETAYEASTDKPIKDGLKDRIASLTGGLAVIEVGGKTETERKELYDRVEDAVCAVRSALDGGVVEGSGLALARIATKLDQTTTEGRILHEGMTAPVRRILENADMTYEDTYRNLSPTPQLNDGYDLRTGTWGDMVEMGIVDPFKVTKMALENAVSVAVTILSTNAVVTMARSYEQGD